MKMRKNEVGLALFVIILWPLTGGRKESYEKKGLIQDG